MEEFKPKTKKISQKEKAELLAMNLKWCGSCKEAMSLDLFSGVKYKVCRECSCKRQIKWRNNNLDYANEKRKAWRAENSERERETTKKRREKNPELARQKEREYHAANKEKIRTRKRKNYHDNIEQRRSYFRAWGQKNKNNPLFVLAKRIRTRTHTAFARKNISKKHGTNEMLGCDWDTLKTHIENQFTEGMSWDKLGEIHIDHIVPLASAKTEEELIRLAHYTNLQPLWALDNISKGDRLNWKKDSDSL